MAPGCSGADPGPRGAGAGPTDRETLMPAGSRTCLECQLPASPACAGGAGPAQHASQLTGLPRMPTAAAPHQPGQARAAHPRPAPSAPAHGRTLFNPSLLPLTSLRRRRWSRTKPMSSSTCAAWLGANLRRTFLKTLRTMKASSAEWLAWCCAAGRGAAWVGANPRQGGAAQRPLNAPVHRASARRMSGVPCKLAAGLAGPDAPPAHRRHTGHA